MHSTTNCLHYSHAQSKAIRDRPPAVQHEVSPSVSLVLFFFYSYVDLRDLHSFPTRRSSDLCGLSVIEGGQGRHVTALDVDVVRSEEHTSELQSRRELVCRLLLEKKKQSNVSLNRCNRLDCNEP